MPFFAFSVAVRETTVSRQACVHYIHFKCLRLADFEALVIGAPRLVCIVFAYLQILRYFLIHSY